ncbi:MAG: hypothetical protein H0T71_08775 [Acidobacteria bacterium]|nr:hypothetical protein [Acidobacteriota bacterium]
MDELLLTIVWIVVGIGVGTVCVFTFWRVRSMIKIWRAPERPLQSVQAKIWQDPGDVGKVDLALGPGGASGAPVPPFSFVEEHVTGSQPCVSVRDGRGKTWRVKWGDEVKVETLATRLAWAAGYFVETTYYLAEGEIRGATDLQRAAGCIGQNCQFRDARFELDEAGVIKHFDEHSWAWNDNPFVGTRELNGLKVVMMWLSNWDAKDLRDVARGSNTAIFEHPSAHGLREARYLIIDWGGALGKWGSIVRRGRWDCAGFASENEAFVQGVNGDVVTFGYTGQRTADIAAGIRVSDVAWLMRTLDQLSTAQIAAAIEASGGTAEDVACFSQALRARLDRLRDIASIPSEAVRRAPVPTLAASGPSNPA